MKLQTIPDARPLRDALRHATYTRSRYRQAFHHRSPHCDRTAFGRDCHRAQTRVNAVMAQAVTQLRAVTR